MPIRPGGEGDCGAVGWSGGAWEVVGGAGVEAGWTVVGCGQAWTDADTAVSIQCRIQSVTKLAT